MNSQEKIEQLFTKPEDDAQDGEVFPDKFGNKNM